VKHAINEVLTALDEPTLEEMETIPA